MAMHPNRFMFYLSVQVAILWVLTLLNPLVIWAVDPILIIGPMWLAFYVIFYYFYSEGHRWAYSLVTHQSHSSTAEGKPSFTIPAQNGYPEMVGFAKGGTRLWNVYGSGGKRDGFLVVPRHQVLDVNGHRTVNTVTRDVHYTALSPHIREVLQQDRRFSERGLVEFGMVPLLKNIKGDFFDYQKAPSLELLLAQAYTENKDLRDNIEALMKDVRSLTSIIGDIGEGLREVPSERLQDRVKRAVGGEDDDR